MNIKDTKIVISPPFGHYLHFDWATPIRGTFTLKQREGIIKNALSTVRYSFKHGGWVNRMGLVNKGLVNVVPFNKNHIYSVAGLNSDEWERLYDFIDSDVSLELNLSCPNKEYKISDLMLQKFGEKFDVCVKVPSTDYKETIKIVNRCLYFGITQFHVGNSVRVKEGGLSGRKIQEVSLKVIDKLKTEAINPFVIAGGGIYSQKDVYLYSKVGANAFSLATIFITRPWNVPSIVKFIKEEL